MFSFLSLFLSASAVGVTTEWVDNGGSVAWYRTCRIKLTNQSEEPLDKVKIAFDLETGQPAVSVSQEDVRANQQKAEEKARESRDTGSDAYISTMSQNDRRFTTYMMDWTLPLIQEQSLIFGINFTDGSGLSASLPTNFIINDDAIPAEPDTEAPSVPQNLTTDGIYATAAKITWSASTDNVRVKEYEVSYQNDENTVKTIVSKDTVTYLKELLPETTYKTRVRAIDTSGNVSEFSTWLNFITQNEVDAPTPTPGKHFGAPYTDGLAYPTPDLITFVDASGLTGSIVGFIVDNGGKPCWGGHLSVYDSNTGLQEDGDARVSNYHKQFFHQYGRGIPSIGGAAGLPMASNASLTPEDLKNMYAEIMDNYQVSTLDFDYEGGFLADTDALTRHAEAVKQLMSEKPDTKIMYTLPVDGSATLQGFNHYGENFLKLLAAEGVYPYIINGMLMEFGEGSKPNMFEACKDALDGMYTHIKNIFGSKWTDEEIWTHMGATPMFGKNNNGKIFTLENQQDLNSYCRTKNMPLMSGWDMIRDVRFSSEQIGLEDHTPYDFSKEIATYEQL